MRKPVWVAGVIAGALSACAPPDFPDEAWAEDAADLPQPRIVPIAPILDADPPAAEAEAAEADLTDDGDALRDRAEALRNRDP